MPEEVVITASLSHLCEMVMMGGQLRKASRLGLAVS